MQISKEDRQAEVPESVRAIQPKKSRAARVFGAFKRHPGKLVLAGSACLLASWISIGVYVDHVEENRAYNAGKSELVLKMEKLEGEKGVEKLEGTLEILEEKVDPNGWVNINSRLDALEALKEIISADNFDSSRLALVDAMAIEISRMCSAEEPLLGEGAENALSEIRAMFKDPNFRPVLGSIALDESKKTGASAIWYLRNFLEYPAVNPATILHLMDGYGEGAGEVLGGLQSLLSNPNFRNAGDAESLAFGIKGMLYVASRVSGENAEDVKRVLVSYFANPNFSRSEMYREERAEEICGIIVDALREDCEELPTMDAILALNKNPNFKIDMLDGKLIANMRKILKNVKCYYWGDRKEAFSGLLESPAFLPKMLDPNDLRGALCVMRLADGQGAKVSLRALQAVEKFANSRYALGVVEAEGLGQKEKEELIERMWQTFRIVINSAGSWDAYKLASFCDRFPAECKAVFEESCRKPGKDCKRAANAIKQILSFYKDSEKATFLPLLEDIVEGKRQNAMGQSKDFALSSIENLGSEEEFAESYSEARRLSEELGIPPSVAAYLNLGYAIRTIGLEKTRMLNQEYGIEYFTRYVAPLKNYFDDAPQENQKSLLRLLGINANQRASGRPVLLLAFAKSDWNDVLSESDLSWLDSASQTYNIAAIEAKNEKEFYRRVAFVARRHGKIAALMVNGHGYPDSISFGEGGGEQSTLDVYDGEEIARLREHFSPHPIILLDACSCGATRHGISALVSKELGGTVFAPGVVISTEKIILDYKGKILGAEYYADSWGEGAKNTRVFENGKMLHYPK